MPRPGKKVILAVLYPDATSNNRTKRALGDLPHINYYPLIPGRDDPYNPKVSSAPTPNHGSHIKLGQMLGSVSGELGLRKYVESKGYDLIVTDSKDGPDCELERILKTRRVECVISQPFYPAYMTRERIAMSPDLRMCLTAGIGSDHVDLTAAMEANVAVCEQSFSNSISVSEHIVMSILNLVRNFVPSHKIAREGGWNIADCVQRSYDVEGMHVGTVACGRIGLAMLKRMKAFDCKLHYYDRHRMPREAEEEYGLTYHKTVEDMVKVCDVISINCPLYPATEYMFNKEMIAKMKPGSYLVNTARGKICDENAVAAALKSGHLAGYAGDVWFPQPAPKSHPWRTAPNCAMTPHISGTSLSAQYRYCSGALETLEYLFNEGGKTKKGTLKELGQDRPEYVIVNGGALAGQGAKSYEKGNTTGGSAAATGTGGKRKSSVDISPSKKRVSNDFSPSKRSIAARG